MVATNPGLRARAGVSRGSKAMYASKARSLASPRAGARRDETFVEHGDHSPRCRARIGRVSGWRWNVVERERADMGHQCPQVRVVEVARCRHRGRHHAVPDRIGDLCIAAFDLPGKRGQLHRQSRERVREDAVRGSGGAVAVRASLQVQAFSGRGGRWCTQRIHVRHDIPPLIRRKLVRPAGHRRARDAHGHNPVDQRGCHVVHPCRIA
jgi:hypothetical protein